MQLQHYVHMHDDTFTMLYCLLSFNSCNYHNAVCLFLGRSGRWRHYIKYATIRSDFNNTLQKRQLSKSFNLKTFMTEMLY